MALPTTPVPPENEAPLDPLGNHTQAWADYHQSVSDKLRQMGLGTTTNDDAAAGAIGEYISANILSGASVPLASNIAANIASIALTAGDWDISGSVGFVPGPTTSRNYVAGAFSISSGALTGLPAGGGFVQIEGAVTADSGTYAVPPGRLSLAAPTTLYLVAQAGFSVSTMRAYGFIAARRAR